MRKQNLEDGSNSHSKISMTDNDAILKENIDELGKDDIIELEEQDSKYKSNQLKLENIKGVLDEKSIKIEKLETDFKCLKDTVGKLNNNNRAWLAIKVAAIIGIFALFFSFHNRVDNVHGRIDNFGNQVNEIHQILKDQESRRIETKTTKIQSQSKTP